MNDLETYDELLRIGPDDKVKHSWGLSLFYSKTLYSSKRRLVTQIRTVMAEIDSLDPAETDSKLLKISKQSSRAIADSIRSQRKGLIEAGWLHLNHAKRILLQAKSAEELESHVECLNQKGNMKLSGWRLEALNNLIKIYNGAESIEKKRSLAIEATSIWDENNDNLYHKREIKKKHIGALLVPLILGTVGFLFALFLASPSEVAHPRLARITDFTHTNFQFISFLTACFFLALTAASLSTITGIASSERVLDEFEDLRITIARTLVGGASGPMAFFIAQSGVFTFAKDKPWETLILAFALGFSEKLLVGMMDRFTANRNRSAVTRGS